MAASLATGMLSPAALLMRAAGMISPITNMAMYGKMSTEEKKQKQDCQKKRVSKERLLYLSAELPELLLSL